MKATTLSQILNLVKDEISVRTYNKLYCFLGMNNLLDADANCNFSLWKFENYKGVTKNTILEFAKAIANNENKINERFLNRFAGNFNYTEWEAIKSN